MITKLFPLAAVGSTNKCDMKTEQVIIQSKHTSELRSSKVLHSLNLVTSWSSVSNNTSWFCLGATEIKKQKNIQLNAQLHQNVTVNILQIS